jgi:type VI secretion system secreted protein Hcp
MAVATAPPPASAAAPQATREEVHCFVKIPGIPGESRDAKHKDEIDALSFRWGVGSKVIIERDERWHLGRGCAQVFSFFKRIDRASPILFLKCLTRDQNFPEVIVTVRRQRDSAAYEPLTFKLKNVFITDALPTGDVQGGDARPLEEIGLVCEACEIVYQPQGPDGKAQAGAIRAGWNFLEKKKL